MNFLRKLAILCFAAAGVAGCGKDVESLGKDRETIRTYLESKLRDELGEGGETMYDVVGGVYRYVANADRDGYEDAATAEKGDVVEFRYEAYAFANSLVLEEGNYNPSLIFATNRPLTLDLLCNQELMAPNPAWERGLWSEEPVVATIGGTALVEGVRRGLPGGREGDVVWLIFASDLGFGEKEFGSVGMNQILAYRLYIEKVTKK